MDENTHLIRISLVIFVDAILIVVLILLFFLDTIVNGLLYDYGLVFDSGWARPYWMMMRVSMWLISIVILILTSISLYPLLWKKRARK